MKRINDTEFLEPIRSLYHEGRKLFYQVELYQPELEQMAVKANHNKSGKSKDGPVTVRILNAQQIEVGQ